MPQLSNFMREDEVAIYFGVSKKTVRRWRAASLGPIFHKLNGNGAVRYAAKDVEEFAAKSLVQRGAFS